METNGSCLYFSSHRQLFPNLPFIVPSWTIFCHFYFFFFIFPFSKTTFAQAVFRELGGATNVVYLSHDHYYKDISHKTLEERSQTNFDHPDSLDTALLVQHIRDLKQGKVANLPTYDFTTHSRTPITTLVHPKKIVLVEGILIFTNPELCHECDIKVFVVSAVEDWTETSCCFHGKANFVGSENSAKKNAFRSHYATEIQFLFFFFGVARIHFTMVFCCRPLVLLVYEPNLK
jgi:Phosphoribulokinase / Uridine kinase family